MNCKQGDLAIIIRAVVPENIGKIVEVVRAPNMEDSFIPIDGGATWRMDPTLDWSNSWVVRSHGAPLAWGSRDKKVALFRERPFVDAALRPIPKLDEPEDVTTEKELTV